MSIERQQKLNAQFVVISKCEKPPKIKGEWPVTAIKTDFLGVAELLHDKGANEAIEFGVNFFYLPKNASQGLDQETIHAIVESGRMLVVGTPSFEEFKQLFPLPEEELQESLVSKNIFIQFGSDEPIPGCEAKDPLIGLEVAFEKENFELPAILSTQKPPQVLNPSNWGIGALLLLVVAAFFVGFAPAEVAGVAALSLVSVASLVMLVTVPIALTFVGLLIYQDFSKQEDEYITGEIEELKQRDDYKQTLISMVPPKGVSPGPLYKGIDRIISDLIPFHASFSPYTFGDYLKNLPKRLWTWAKEHRGQAVVLGVGVGMGVAILFLLLFGTGLGPVAAVAGFLGHLFSTGFTALAAVVPALGGLTQASGIMAGIVAVLTPVVIAANVTRAMDAVQGYRINKAYYELVDDSERTPAYQEMRAREEAAAAAKPNEQQTAPQPQQPQTWPGGQGRQPPTVPPTPQSVPAPPIPAPPHDKPPLPPVFTQPQQQGTQPGDKPATTSPGGANTPTLKPGGDTTG